MQMPSELQLLEASSQSLLIAGVIFLEFPHINIQVELIYGK